MIAVTGTCPLSAPREFSSMSRGSIVRRASSRGSPATATVRAIGAASPTENSSQRSTAARTISSATTESLPPPTGTSTDDGSRLPSRSSAPAAGPAWNSGRGSAASPAR